VRKRIGTLLPDLNQRQENDYRIVIRAYASLSELEKHCQRASIADPANQVQAFTRGFTKSYALCDFIDVAGGTNDVIDKVSGKSDSCHDAVVYADMGKESLALYLNDYHCRQIMLCCSNDKRYSDLLQQTANDERNFSRITLIEGTTHDSNTAISPFETVNFDHILETKFVSNNSSVITRQLSNLDVGEIKEFTPGSTPLSTPRPNAFTTISANPSASSSPAGLWASIAAKPAVSVVPPPATTLSDSSPAKSSSVDGIPRNRKGQRIDAAIKHDKAEVDRVKKLKMCNTHFLRGFCPVKTCPHVHDCKPTAAELTTLRLVARMAPCMNGGECDDAKCIYGHVCPAPLHRDGRVTRDGKDCIFQEDCRFEGSRHLRGEDRKEVRFIKVT